MTMTMQMLQQMRSYLDESSKESSYTVQELRNNGMIYTSYFDDKNKAKSYARKYCDESSTIYIYKTYCIKIYDPVDNILEEEEREEYDVDYSPENDFSNMTVWKYGSGYLLIPPEDSEYFGNKYFHEGWWIKSQNGWFFKKEYYQSIIDNGAIISEEHEEDIEYSTDLSTMTLWRYGKGYLIEPSEDSEYYGQKYFHSGWWMTKQNGWFFKADDYDWLVENGAKLSVEEEEEEEEEEVEEVEEVEEEEVEEEEEEEEEDESDVEEEEEEEESDVEEEEEEEENEEDEEEEEEEEIDLSQMSISEYGKGYILHTTENDERYGKKYFMDGFWNTKQNGWFFKEKYFDDLVSMGAKFIKPEPVESLFGSTELSSSITNDSFEYVHNDSEFMTSDNKPVPKFVKYEKGWILKEDTHYIYNKNNYFEGGKWNPSLKAWFFKKKDKKKFMKKHFEI